MSASFCRMLSSFLQSCLICQKTRFCPPPTTYHQLALSYSNSRLWLKLSQSSAVVYSTANYLHFVLHLHMPVKLLSFYSMEIATLSRYILVMFITLCFQVLPVFPSIVNLPMDKFQAALSRILQVSFFIQISWYMFVWVNFEIIPQCNLKIKL